MLQIVRATGVFRDRVMYEVRDASVILAHGREVSDAKNNEAHGAMDKEHHVCARQRVGELAVSQVALSLRTPARR